MLSKTGFKKNSQIIYSIALIIFIPLAIIANTLFFTKHFKANIDQELYNKAISIGEVINATVLDDINNQEGLQNKINRIAEFNEEIQSLDILIPDGEQFLILASLDETAANQKASNVQATVAWMQNQPVAFLTASNAKNTVSQEINFSEENERFWTVTMPVKNANGEKTALLSMKVSLKVVDKITKTTLVRSYIILTFTILIIILLLANNTKLFEYASLYKKIKEVDQMKDEFISVASHELRTPVTGIKGYVDMILEGTMGEVNNKVKESLELVRGASERLAVLVEDLLNVSRIEQGRLQMDLKDVAPGKIIEDVVRELKIQSDQKCLSLKYSPLAENLPAINIDTDRFKQVLINIIGNAIKYTEKGGVEIFVEEKNKDRALEIRIKDTGIGMSAKDRERLFEKFYRVQNEKTVKITGTGLGLWITKQIVELMRGKIMVDSIEGVGTQITLSFPIKNNT